MMEMFRRRSQSSTGFELQRKEIVSTIPPLITQTHLSWSTNPLPPSRPRFLALQLLIIILYFLSCYTMTKICVLQPMAMGGGLVQTGLGILGIKYPGYQLDHLQSLHREYMQWLSQWNTTKHVGHSYSPYGSSTLQHVSTSTRREMREVRVPW